MAIIKMNRDSGYADRARSYKVMVNNECVGKIGNGESKEFELPAGEYEVFLKIDWCRSKKINVTLSDSSIETFYVTSPLRGMNIFLSAYYTFFASSEYITLSTSKPV